MTDEKLRDLNSFLSLDRKLQILLSLRYSDPATRPLSLRDVEFRSFSQNGEDGILLYLFSVLGITNRKVVEICAGDGIESNSANLIVNHGWQGLLFDGDAAQIERGRHLYSQLKDTCLSPPVFAESWITAENVNDEIRRRGFEGEIDLLSLDLDGNDYWIWKAIECIRPRVVVVEYTWHLGAHRSVTIPYDPQFRLDFSRTPYYCGASLAAFAALGREKGYRLVGTTRLEFNAFFVRNDLAPGKLPEIPVSDCFSSSADYDWGDRVWVEV